MLQAIERLIEHRIRGRVPVILRCRRDLVVEASLEITHTRLVRLWEPKIHERDFRITSRKQTVAKFSFEYQKRGKCWTKAARNRPYHFALTHNFSTAFQYLSPSLTRACICCVSLSANTLTSTPASLANSKCAFGSLAATI